ncbi:MAG TPA: hypothetical protein VNN79_17640 [Actinomycetota bacterium]|nr:hypothetical protein [Actinomycetota bacterium]
MAQEFDKHGDIYFEGSVSFLRLSSPDGIVFNARFRHDRLRRIVPAGDYAIRSYQRPCDGNCGLLDAPADICEQSVTIAPGQTTKVHVVIKIGSGCTFDLP